jgi:hypothetical protein
MNFITDIITKSYFSVDLPFLWVTWGLTEDQYAAGMYTEMG